MSILIVESEQIKKKLNKLVNQFTKSSTNKNIYARLYLNNLKFENISFTVALSDLINFTKKHKLANLNDSLMQESLYASIADTLDQDSKSILENELSSKNNFKILNNNIQKWIHIINVMLKISEKTVNKSNHQQPMANPAVRGFGLLNVFTNDKDKAKHLARKLVNKQVLKPLEPVVKLYKPDVAKKRKVTYINEVKNTTPYHRRIQWMTHHLLYEWPTIPQRSTKGSAGYDLRANRYTVIPSCRKNPEAKPVNVHTGLKAYFPNGEMLGIFNRSSNPIKRHLFLSNGVGVDDADYYCNPSNDGELLVSLINTGSRDYVIHRGDRIAQGVFLPCLKADIDMPVKAQRKGGQGSTGK